VFLWPVLGLSHDDGGGGGELSATLCGVLVSMLAVGAIGTYA
jgi:hypothetical protein